MLGTMQASNFDSVFLIVLAENRGWKFFDSATSLIFRLRSSEIAGWSLKARDTVEIDTPHSAAISARVMEVFIQSSLRKNNAKDQ